MRALFDLGKRAAGKLPDGVQQELRRHYWARLIRKGRFTPDEPEYEKLPAMLFNGAWAIDIGANVGQYTRRFSELVGPEGRVIAMEPIPSTFALLASNATLFPHQNVTLLNMAASDTTGIVRMTVPKLSSGLANYYMANISDHGDTAVVQCPVDNLELKGRVALVKIDAEGHEYRAIKGMANLLSRDMPLVIAEGRDESLIGYLEGLSYAVGAIKGSPNSVYIPPRLHGKYREWFT